MEHIIIISFNEEKEFRERCKSEISFYESRLDKLETRLRIINEEIRQTRELISILHEELRKGGQ